MSCVTKSLYGFVSSFILAINEFGKDGNPERCVAKCNNVVFCPNDDIFTLLVKMVWILSSSFNCSSSTRICKVEVDVTFKTPKFLNDDVTGYNVFRKFQDITFNLKVAQPTYLYVFNIDNNSVKLVFPFKYGEHTKVDKSGVWPSSYTDKHSLVALMGSGVERLDEKLVFLFSQHPIHITTDDFQLNQFESFLSSIPIESKRVLKRNIVITKWGYCE